MNLPTITAVNITEILIKIVRFTKSRHEILIQNINDIHGCGFVPKDLPAEEFSNLMNEAIAEYVEGQRLVLRDGPNVKFDENGGFTVIPIIDEQAGLLLKQNQDEYLQGQIRKILENSLNQRIAMELLKNKQANKGCLGRCLN